MSCIMSNQGQSQDFQIEGVQKICACSAHREREVQDYGQGPGTTKGPWKL